VVDEAVQAEGDVDRIHEIASTSLDDFIAFCRVLARR